MLTLLLPSLALAVPTTLTHQGRLLDADGRPAEGLHLLQFDLYPDLEGGAPVWSEMHALTLSSGLYTVELGRLEMLDDRVFDGASLYLELGIDGGPPMAPRHALTSVPYAQRAAVADAVSFDAIEGLPAELADGDADTLGMLVCGDGELPVAVDGGWVCGVDAVLTEDDVDGMVSDNGYALVSDLATVARTGSYTDLTDVPPELVDGDADTLGALLCADGPALVAASAVVQPFLLPRKFIRLPMPPALWAIWAI